MNELFLLSPSGILQHIKGPYKSTRLNTVCFGSRILLRYAVQAVLGGKGIAVLALEAAELGLCVLRKVYEIGSRS